VLVQRGTSHKTGAATLSRCGQIRYWTGSAYSTAGFSTAAAGPYVTAPVTWASGTTTVTASARVTLDAASSQVVATDSTCTDTPCSITANTGRITVVVEYVISHSAVSYTVVSTTVVQGPSATASFQEAKDA
jgi:hypothetical protein